MTFPDFLARVRSGVPMRLQNRKAYLRLTNHSLSAVSSRGEKLHLWITGTGKSKNLLRALRQPVTGIGSSLPLEDWWELLSFLKKWEEMRAARDWKPGPTFPGLREIAAFVYLTLVPELWQVWMEEEDGSLSVPLEHYELTAAPDQEYIE